MQAMEVNIDRMVEVRPVAVKADMAWSGLRLADGITGSALWLTEDGWCVDGQEDDWEYFAEYIGVLYGADDGEWTARANERLATYGLKLGRFDEERQDRYWLEEL